MRTFLVLAWFMIPLGGWAYHQGPGQQKMRMDQASDALAAADQFATDQQWKLAVGKYNTALELLPQENKRAVRRIRLERAKAMMLSSGLADAHRDLLALVDEMKADDQANPQVLAQAQSALANTQYYITWLMRLEGLSRDDWEPQIEAARQTYRMLAERAEDQGEAKALKKHREDLEATIRLARMDLGQLQGLPIPSQCQGCKSGQCQGKRPGKGKSKSKKTGKKDARGASSGPPPDDQGA